MSIIPVLNFNEIDKNFGKFSEAASNSMHNYGFVGLIIPELREVVNILEELHVIFAKLPVKTKEKWKGYTWLKENAEGEKVVDIKGFIHLFPKRDPNDKYTLQIPLNEDFSEIPGLLEAVENYIEFADRVSDRMLQAMAFGAGLERNFFEFYAKNGFSSARLLDYPGEEEFPGIQELLDIGAERAKPHGDINLTTLLPVSNKGGLQVLYQDKYINAPIDPRVFLFNSGDMMARLTNDYYPSVWHKVTNGLLELRTAYPYFKHGRRYWGDDKILECHSHFISESSPAKYEPTTFGLFFWERINNIGITGTNT